MNFRECSCTPEVLDPKYRAWIATSAGGIYSPGRTVEQALANVEAHAKKDRIPKSSWRAVHVTEIPGDAMHADVTAWRGPSSKWTLQPWKQEVPA